MGICSVPRCFVLLLVVLLVGCASGPRGPGRVDYSALVLAEPVTIPEGRARAYLQNGVQVRAVNEFVPHCALEIRHTSGPPRTVPVGRYAITRVQDVSTPIVLNAGGRQLARVGVGVSVGSGGSAIGIGFGTAGVTTRGDSPSDIFEGYHFWLEDSAGVGLMRLTCLGARAQPVDVKPPTRAEIDRALGELGRLEVRP